MPIEQLIFVGLNGYVAALHRDTGKLIWSNKELQGTYVTMLLDGDRLIVSSSGYIYCLCPQTGKVLWHNPMKGFGMGVPAALISIRGQENSGLLQEQIAAIHSASSS